MLITWLLRRGANHYRSWAVVGLTVVLLMGTAPCWFEFPGQDFGPPRIRERGAISVLRRVQAAEDVYRAQFNRYSNFLEIKVDGMELVDCSRGFLYPAPIPKV
jgi:hypothetical protein